MRAVAIVIGTLGLGLAAVFATRSSRNTLGRALERRVRKRLGESDVDPFESTGDPWAPQKDEPDYDGGCLILGKQHFRFSDGPYRVCLTDNQEKTLFRGQRRKQTKIGCGVFACAYTAPGSSRVVKFTRDSEDVAALLKAQKTGVVPKIYAVYKLKQGGRTIPKRDPFSMRTPEVKEVSVYALVSERLRTIPSSEREIVDESLSSLFQVADGTMTADQFCDSQQDDEGRTGCDDVQLYTLRAMEKLKKAGIKWRDIHSGNIGYDKNGRLKVLDLGLTNTELKRRLKVLEGRLRSGKQPRLAGLRLV